MSKAASSSNVVATRYVGALIDLVEGSSQLNAVEKDFSDLAAMLTSSQDFKSFIRSPLNTLEQQMGAVEAISKGAQFNEITVNFLKVLVSNRRLGILESILEVFVKEVSKRRGEVSVTVETAQDISAGQIKALQSSLQKEMGSDVAIHAKVSPDILGGMIVTVGSHMIDDSVARKLERLKAVMSGGANGNKNLKEAI